ncbi:uncharacterized protein LOC143657668 isoform X1 [Tamandua tetradactyla]|uniref:uncharacterized protein LOC143657668 isoform X1 n=1 Tax=Tamandua tetradactyla TaxID=48850 RepID=UPI004053DE2B
MCPDPPGSCTPDQGQLFAPAGRRWSSPQRLGRQGLPGCGRLSRRRHPGLAFSSRSWERGCAQPSYSAIFPVWIFQMVWIHRHITEHRVGPQGSTREGWPALASGLRPKFYSHRYKMDLGGH